MQFGIALHSYDSVHEMLPPGVVSGSNPVLDLPRGYGFGWMTQILPYFEMRNVYNHFNLQVGLYEPPNFTTRTSLIPSFLCPTDFGPTRDSQRVAMNNYVGVHHDVKAPIAADNHGVLFLNSHVRYEDVTDGLSLTLIVGETIHDGLGQGWASGTRQPEEYGADGRQRAFPGRRHSGRSRSERRGTAGAGIAVIRRWIQQCRIPAYSISPWATARCEF